MLAIQALSANRYRTVLLLWLLLFGATVQAEILLQEAWIQEAPPGAQVLAGYLVLENVGAGQDALVAVESPAFARVELHRSRIIDEVARMEAQSQLVLPPGETLTMRPGDYHLMLFEPTQPLREGMTIELALKFANSNEQTHVIEVQRRRAGTSGRSPNNHQHLHDGHGHHDHTHH